MHHCHYTYIAHFSEQLTDVNVSNMISASRLSRKFRQMAKSARRKPTRSPVYNIVAVYGQMKATHSSTFYVTQQVV